MSDVTVDQVWGGFKSSLDAKDPHAIELANHIGDQYSKLGRKLTRQEYVGLIYNEMPADQRSAVKFSDFPESKIQETLKGLGASYTPSSPDSPPKSSPSPATTPRLKGDSSLISGFLTTPLLQSWEAPAEAAIGAVGKMVTAPFSRIAEKVGIGDQVKAISGFSTGFAEGAVDAGLGLTSPFNLVTMGAMSKLKYGGKVAQVARALASGSFTIGMLADLPPQFKAVGESWQKKDYEGAGRAFARATADALFAYGGGKEAVESGKLARGGTPPLPGYGKPAPPPEPGDDNFPGQKDAQGKPVPFERANPELAAKIDAERARLSKKGKPVGSGGKINVPPTKSPASMSRPEVEREIGELNDQLTHMQTGTPEAQSQMGTIEKRLQDLQGRLKVLSAPPPPEPVKKPSQPAPAPKKAAPETPAPPPEPVKPAPAPAATPTPPVAAATPETPQAPANMPPAAIPPEVKAVAPPVTPPEVPAKAPGKSKAKKSGKSPTAELTPEERQKRIDELQKQIEDAKKAQAVPPEPAKPEAAAPPSNVGPSPEEQVEANEKKIADLKKQIEDARKAKLQTVKPSAEISEIGKSIVDQATKGGMDWIRLNLKDASGKVLGDPVEIGPTSMDPDFVSKVIAEHPGVQRIDIEPVGKRALGLKWSKFVLGKTDTAATPPTSPAEPPPGVATSNRPPLTRLKGTGEGGPVRKSTFIPPGEQAPEAPKARPPLKRLKKSDASLSSESKSGDGLQMDAAVTGTGKIKLGADVKSLGTVLGSSLYIGKEAHVVTKELMQNAYDAVRGVKDGEIKVSLSSWGDDKSITVSDNGKGMTGEELGTVFTDLGASGKRGQAEASGGFGLAKAAPLMMSERISVESVVEKNGAKVRSSFTATPDELLGAGVDLKQEVVSADTPTGTKIVSILPANSKGWSEANSFLTSANKSVNPPGKLTLEGSLGNKEPRVLTKLKKISLPNSADVQVYASKERKGLQQGRGYIPVEVNNNGIYQFDSSIYLGKSATIKDVPAVIAVDIKSTVPEGHPNYPFSANRESLRGDALNEVNKYVLEEIVRPAIERGNKFLEQKYDSLPKMRSSYEIPIFDSGARLTPQELRSMQNNPDLINLGEEVALAVDQSIAKLMESTKLPDHLAKLGEGIERAGLVFSDELHGVHIRKGEGGKATLFVNPFSYDKNATPTEAASMLWHTIKHEILHDKVSGHYEAFTSGEVKISQALGGLEIDSLLRLRGVYADEGNPGKFRPGIDRALQIYRESRGRAERERDPFGGEESRQGDHGPAGERGDAPPVRSGGEEPVPELSGQPAPGPPGPAVNPR